MEFRRWRRLRPWALLAAILVLAAIFRCWRIASWPFFCDEDQYATTTRRVMESSFLQSFVTAARVGKKPVLLFWICGLIWPIVGDPVVAGRWISAVAGVICTWLCFVLGRKIDGIGAGLFAALIYAASPWAILQDRQYIQDPAMTALVLGTIVFVLKQIQSPGKLPLTMAALLSFLAVFAKPPAVLLAAVPLVAYLAYLPRPWPRRSRRDVVILSCVPAVTFLVLVYAQLGSGHGRFAPFSNLPENWLAVSQAVVVYMSPGVAMLMALGALILFHIDRRAAILFVLLLLGWTIFWMLFSDFAPSRYYLPTVALAAVLAGIGISRPLRWAFQQTIWPKTMSIIGVGLILAFPVFAGVKLVRDPKSARMTHQDDWQYRSGWPAGYAYAAAADYVRTHVPGNAELAYAIYPHHQEAAGVFSPIPSGARSLGLVSPEEIAGPSPGTAEYLMVDDGQGPASRHNVEQILRKFPTAKELARFDNPGGQWGLSIILIPYGSYK